MLCALAGKYKAGVIYVNQVGGNDELIFDGSSMLCSAEGRLFYQAPPFQEALFYFYTEDLNLMNRGEKTRMDLAEENIQARIRGNILMFISNREGRVVLTTGNKSELAVGYCTLYGDMSGGLAALGDVPKTMVYQLAEFINTEAGHQLIPRRVIEKAPSAELRPDQKDQDLLPPYEILDQILHYYIEENKHIDEITALGFDYNLVKDVINKIDRAEYKRVQAAPVLRVTTKAFGSGRRMPIARAQIP